MKKTTWVILGATSIIAQEFAHLAAQQGHSLILVGRRPEELDMIKSDLQLRYRISCQLIIFDFTQDILTLVEILVAKNLEIALFMAYSTIIENSLLTHNNISSLVNINILSATQLIHAYLQIPQQEHRIIFLSSVAACRGRAKNSLYGASKAAVEVYLQGLQQQSAKTTNRHITIARLGFIDTAQTFGLPGIFYASPPRKCALACWQASYANKPLIYHPRFWQYIMLIIRQLPFVIYKKLKI